MKNHDLMDLDLVFVSASLAGGGAARVQTVLANHYAESGLKVGIFIFHSHSVKYKLDPRVKLLHATPGNDSLSKAKRIFHLRRLMRTAPKATFVPFEYFVNIQTIIAGLGLKTNIVASERNDPSRVGNHFPIGFLRRMLYPKLKTLVCQTSDAADFFSTKITKEIILNPLKPNLPPPYSGKRRKTVVTFCRLTEQKNLPLLIRSFADFTQHYPEYSLEIYGDGELLTELNSLIEELGLSEKAHIYPAHENIHEKIIDCSFFVLPSDYEGLSNSMLEAMAIGLPTICTDCPCGGARTVIKDKSNGIIVPPGDQKALCDALISVASDASYAELLSLNASALREHLSVPMIARQWSEVLDIA